MGTIIIYVTHSSLDEAKKMANELLNRKLIACANFMPIESCCFWEGKITSEHEYVSLFKTRSTLWVTVRDEVEQLHPYDTPCIMKFDITANTSFEKWVESVTQD